ncbi:hypothetical protein BV25DRAFT_1919599 [Artomyces pyxidatus]|uniref:Uncharacterized protein n=1 Tax=Artomyces pyxidatus TaxID=48021 RepID=A0ACB8SQ27_9AGAM|nr:hypothetical protein BV25DRAFT_1919599 [Artomyces pyxidatus]
MDAKLHVADLKDVLARAHVAAPARATKADLVAKILASPDALAAYSHKYSPPPQVDVPAPPVVSSTPNEPQVAQAPTPAPVTVSAPAPAPAAPSSPPKPTVAQSAPTAADTPAPTAPVDDEAQKRAARAARFGIPLVEQKPKVSLATAPPLGTKAPKAPKPKPAAAASPAAKAKPVATTPDDPERLKARAQRFNTQPKPAAATPAEKGTSPNRKRPVPAAEEVDAAELERRRKRQERFGNAVSTKV